MRLKFILPIVEPKRYEEPKHYPISNIRRAHWGIETGLHSRRNVTFKEDATRMTIGHAAQILASIHNLVIALIRHATFLSSEGDITPLR
jgi:hypothetical protein